MLRTCIGHHLYCIFFSRMCSQLRMWVDISDKLHPHSTSIVPSLPQANIHTVHPPPLRSYFPSPSLHIQPHHSFPKIFFVPSRDMSAPLEPSFLHFLGYFSSFRSPSNSASHHSSHLCNITYPSQHNHFSHVQLFVMCILCCQC